MVLSRGWQHMHIRKKAKQSNQPIIKLPTTNPQQNPCSFSPLLSFKESSRSLLVAEELSGGIEWTAWFVRSNRNQQPGGTDDGSLRVVEIQAGPCLDGWAFFDGWKTNKRTTQREVFCYFFFFFLGGGWGWFYSIANAWCIQTCI